MRSSAIRSFVWAVPVLLACALSARAAQPDRVTAAIDNNQTVVVADSVYGKAQPQFDQGPVDPEMKLGRIVLEIAPSPAQQAALDHLLAEQQDSSSPKYHEWLTPEQYADRFGLSRGDVTRITRWLRAQGYSNISVARARNWIAFSGTAAQAQNTFHTQIHRYSVDGEQHYANATNISLPKALASVVTHVRGLHDFLWKSFIAGRTISPAQGGNPDYSNGGQNFLAPGDIATIYHIDPLYTNGINGTNMSLVIVGQTDIATSDITAFRSGFSLPAINLQQILAAGGTGCIDPGIVNPDQAEADLDLEWSGAVAQDAKIIFVKCDVNHGGVFTSAQYAIDNKLAPVISMSYGGCESQNGRASALAVQQLIQQANSEGITFFSSAGDSGAAACDPDTSLQATRGLAVNLPASVPEVTGVGGTEFDEGSGNYWGSNQADHHSALGYIPELGWDDSSAGTGFSSGLASSGGGKSIYFAKPSWQTGSGVPNDSARDVPDVAMTASADHDGYILCTGGSCGGGVLNGSIVGGTSASTPVFAALVTLLNQYLVVHGIEKSGTGLGNINPTLYQLAKGEPAAFHDAPAGNYNITGATANPSGNVVPCQTGTPNCSTGKMGFRTTTGYDQVTGLGSVDANNFVTLWANSSKIPTGTTVTATPATITAGSTTAVTLKATVTHGSGNGTPTGTVTFFSNASKLGSGTLSNGSASFSYNVQKLKGGAYTITATYNGDGNFAGSNSSSAQLNVQDFTVAASPTTITVTSPGQEGSSLLTITSLGGFSGTVSYTCSGLPAGANCTFAADAQNNETLTISTTAASSQLRESPFRRRSGPVYALLLPGIVGLLIPVRRRKSVLRHARLLGLLAVLAVSTLWMASCGGGGSGNGGNPGTPAGTSTVTVTASATGLSHQVPVTLTVQ